MALVKLPKMAKLEVAKLIKGQMICRIAFRGDRSPYLIPFQYTYFNGHLYFHFTNYGRKIELLKRDEPVCVEIEEITPDMRKYAFVALTWTLKVVMEPMERGKVVRKMAEEGVMKLSDNFLAVHGFNREDGWSALSPEKPLIIVKLDKISEFIGLKSPSEYRVRRHAK